ncbi:MAG: hypothetical protein IBX44_00815 [Sulfurospirillum sp.]|nr:hypothetical protein [Sulfurospirillum sp.]
MTLYKTTITPTSNFATTLKGDTLFGQLCWAIRYTFGEEKLKLLLDGYEENPFCVVSDGFAPDFLPKPTLPTFLMKESEDKKANRKKIWMSYEDLQKGDFSKAKEDEKSDVITLQMHNAINYKTFTTGDGFAPYGIKEFALNPKDVYILLDEEKFTLDALSESFKTLSRMGYGQDSTIGKGRFEFTEFKKFQVQNSSTVMALSPFSPQGFTCKDIFYTPFTRFGKKGAHRANQNPFKKPLLLADTGTVIVFEDDYKKRYIGKAIKRHTSHEDIVHQGYAIAIGIKEL